MILKLGMKHQGEKLYKVYINHDLGMTLTYFIYPSSQVSVYRTIGPLVYVFPMTPPGVGPVWTPGARLARFIKRTTIHCYTQNRKALELVASGKKIFVCFSHCKSMGANDPQDGAFFDPMLVGFRYKEDHYTLLHTKYESSGPCGFAEEDFLCFFPCHPRCWVCMDPRGMVGRIYKEYHYTLLHTKYESSGPDGFGEEDFLIFFPLKVYGS